MVNEVDKKELIRKYLKYHRQESLFVIFSVIVGLIIHLVLYFGYNAKTFSQMPYSSYSSPYLIIIGTGYLVLLFIFFWWPLIRRGQIRDELCKDNPEYIKRKPARIILWVSCILALFILKEKTELLDYILFWVILFLGLLGFLLYDWIVLSHRDMERLKRCLGEKNAE